MRLPLEGLQTAIPHSGLQAFRTSPQQLALNGSAALSTLGMGLVIPILPSYAESLGGTASLVGLLIAAFAATRLLVALPAAWLATRIGHRRLLVTGPAITVPAALLCAAAGGFWTLAVFCVVEGAMAGSSATASTGLVLSGAPERKAGRSLGSYQAAALTGAAVGPLLGGLIGGEFGVRALFVVYAAIAGSTAVWLHLALNRPIQSAAGFTGDLANRGQRAWRVLAARSVLPLWFLAFALAFSRIGTQLVAVPFIGARRLGLGPGEIGFALALGGFASLAVFYPAGWLADRFGRKAAVVPGGAGIAVALALLAVSDSYAEFLIAALLLGVAGGLAGPAPAAHLADALPAPQRTLGAGAYRVAGEAGAIVAPAVLGWSVGSGEFNAVLLASAALVAMAAASFAWLTSGQAPAPAAAIATADEPFLARQQASEATDDQ